MRGTGRPDVALGRRDDGAAGRPNVAESRHDEPAIGRGVGAAERATREARRSGATGDRG